MLRIISILFVVALSLAYASSEPPSPTPSKHSQPPQSQHASSNHPTSADQNITPKSPVEVKLLNTGKTPEETAADTKERNEKTSSDWWLIVLTGVLAFLAFLQLIAFTYQGWQLKRTVDSAENASIPYVFPAVSDVNLIPFNPQIPYVEFILFNYGKTPALIREARVELCLTGDFLNSKPTFTESAKRIAHAEVIAGESAGTKFMCKFGRALTDEERIGLKSRVSNPQFRRFYFFGYIKYEDFFGYTRTNGFVLKLFPNRKVLIKNYPGYAYKKQEKTREEKIDTTADE